MYKWRFSCVFLLLLQFFFFYVASMNLSLKTPFYPSSNCLLVLFLVSFFFRFLLSFCDISVSFDFSFSCFSIHFLLYIWPVPPFSFSISKRSTLAERLDWEDELVHRMQENIVSPVVIFLTPHSLCTQTESSPSA